jgi:hypothetical protein
MLDREVAFLIGQVEKTGKKQKRKTSLITGPQKIKKKNSEQLSQTAVSFVKFLKFAKPMPNISCLCKELKLTPEKFT